MKRLFDTAVSTFLLIILAPLLLVLGLLVRAKIGSPVLFAQDRPGRGGRPFRLYKFRTMSGTRDESGALLPDEERLGRFGRFLRSTSADELPELWNVVRGDMSLAGPRPLLSEYLPLYTPRQARRHEVRPGITGWAQVNGRNVLGWAERLELDTWYVENRSAWLDARILWLTVGAVVRRDGISQTGQATCDPFRGNEAMGNEGPK